MNTSNKLNIFAQVRELPVAAAIGFCATMLERQVPNFTLFCQVCEFETEGQMEKAQNQLWLAYDAVKAKRKVTTNMGLLRDKVEAIAPDAHEYDNFGVYPAIDCAMAMVGAISLVAGDEPQGAVMLSKLSQGSVEAVILATEGELDNQEVKVHPLMQREVEFQRELLNLLTSGNKHLPSAERLQELALQDGATNIGIEVEV